MTPALVVLTDFFAVSNRALSYAAGLAVPLHAPLVLLHVRHDGLLSPDEYRHPHQHTPSERQTQQSLHRLAQRQPVPTEVEISEDFLPDAVAEAVRQHHPQLLVLGRPGTAATPTEVVTGAAMDLLRHVPYPLLTVPTTGWDQFPPRRLALAIDTDDFTLLEGQDVVHRLLSTLHGTLTLVHVVEGTTSDDEAREHTLRQALRSGLPPVPASQPIHLVRHAHVAEGIMQGAADVQADLLILIARRHSLQGSLFHRSATAQVINDSPIPVLLLPTAD